MDSFKPVGGLQSEGRQVGSGSPSTPPFSLAGLLATVHTDEGGWYAWYYKQTGEGTNFPVKVPAQGTSQSVNKDVFGLSIRTWLCLPVDRLGNTTFQKSTPTAKMATIKMDVLIQSTEKLACRISRVHYHVEFGLA